MSDTKTHSDFVNETQYVVLYRKWYQDSQGLSYDEFLDTVQPTFALDNAIVVRWCGMYLCIERDGYCHT